MYEGEIMILQGRKKPYTSIGIGRKKCARCGERAMFQWNICALGNLFHPICEDCDISLNDTVLKFMGISDRKRKKIVSEYRMICNG